MALTKDEFYKTLQSQIQIAFLKAIKNTTAEAKMVNADTADLAFCIGSSVASVAFELIRDNDQICNLNTEQTKVMEVMLSEMTRAYKEKVDIISNPMKMIMTIKRGTLD